MKIGITTLVLLLHILIAYSSAQTIAWLSGAKISAGTTAVFQTGVFEDSGSLLTIGTATSSVVQLAPPISLQNPFGNTEKPFTFIARYNPATGVSSFAKRIDCGSGLASVPSGGFITLCPFQSNGFAIDFIRYDANGNLIWRKQYPYTVQNGIFLQSRFLLVEPTGQFFYAVGSYKDNLAWGTPPNTYFINSIGKFDVFVARFSVATGELEWLASIGNVEDNFPLEVKLRPNGNLVVFTTATRAIYFGGGLELLFDGVAIVTAEYNTFGAITIARALPPISIAANSFLNIKNLRVDDALTTIWFEGDFQGIITFPNNPVPLVNQNNRFDSRLLGQFSIDGTFQFAKLVATQAQGLRSNVVLDPVLNQLYIFFTVGFQATFPDTNLVVNGRRYVLEVFNSDGSLRSFKQSGTFAQSQLLDIIFKNDAVYLFGYVVGTLLWDTRSVGSPITPRTITGFVGKIITKPLPPCAPCANCCKDVVIGSVCYDSNIYECADAVTLCGKFDEACGTVCYNPNTHSCNSVNFLEPK